jgi:hypothetical protein
MRSRAPYCEIKCITMRKGKGSSLNIGKPILPGHTELNTLTFFLIYLSLLLICSESAFSQQNYTWTGAVSQVYNLPGNWSPSGVPGQNDTIILNAGTISIATGNPVLLGGIYLTNGTIVATDNLTFSGNMYWNTGTWSGTGTLTCSANSILFFRGTSGKYINMNINNLGTIIWEGSGGLIMGNGAVLSNSGLFEIRNNSFIGRSVNNLPRLYNLSNGIIRKLSSTGRTTFDQATLFTNEGLFEVLSGSLEIRSTSTISGTLEIKNGSPLILSGQMTWTASSLLKSNGEVILSGTHEFGGTYDVLKKTTSSGSNSNFPGTVSNLGDTLNITSGTINFLSHDISVPVIQLVSGYLGGTAAIQATRVFNLSGGYLNGTGSINIPVNAIMNISGTPSKSINESINNQGTIIWEGSGGLIMGNGAVLSNSGLFEIRNNSFIGRSVNNLPRLYNLSNGIIRKLSSTGRTTFDQATLFTNDGLFEVLSGSLEIRSTSTISGTLEIKNGSPLILSGQMTWTASSLLKSNGEVILSGTHEFGGIYDVLKKTTASGSNSNFSGTVSNLGDTLNITSGTINFLSHDISVPVIQLVSGYLGGTASIQATRVFNLSGGYLNGTGSINIPLNAIMNISGTPSKSINENINNLGTIIWEGSGGLIMGNGAVLSNSGLFEIRNNSVISRSVNSLPKLNNLSTGIIRKITDGITTFGQAVIFNQQGLIDLQKGTLILATNAATYAGIFKSARNTLVSLESGTHDFNPGANLALDGLLVLKSGSIRFNIDYTLPPNTLMTGGDLGGSGIITVSDTLRWSGGNLTDTSNFNIDTSGVLIVSGINGKYINKRKIINSGFIFMSGGALSLDSYSVISNKGHFIIDGPFRISSCCGGQTEQRFTNMDNGDFLMNASNGTINFVGVNFTNRGNLEINHGIFDINLMAVTYTGGYYTQLTGTTKLNSGEFRTSREIRIKGGNVTGSGLFSASMFNSGILNPGPDAVTPGSITISGQYKQDTSGVLQIDIGGRSPISGYDQLTTGNAVLAGDLNINYIRNYKPVAEDKFRVVRWLTKPNQGTFDKITNLQLEGGKVLETKYTVNDLTLYGNLVTHDLWVQVIGTPFIRPGSTNMVRILFGNEGADTLVFPMLLEFNHINNYKLLFDYIHFPDWIPWADPDAAAAYPDSVKDVFTDSEAVRIPLLVTIPGRKPADDPQKFNEFGVNLTPKCDNGAGVTVSIGEPLNPDIESCLWGIAGELVGFLPGGACVEAGIKTALSGMQTYSDHIKGKPVTVGGWITSNSWDIAKCAISFVPGMSLVTKTASILDKIMSGAGKAKLAMDCGAALLPPEGGKSAAQSFTCVASCDPNQKVGPAGYNILRYIKGNNPLAYAVYFENVDTATAPAQTVIITDTLKAGSWDLSTFSFSSISIGDTTVYPPMYVSTFYLEVDLRPDNNLITGITGKLDEASGIITWKFVSLDPVTRKPTTDPLAGFLPPNLSPPQGQGNVVYVVQPNLDLPSGTLIGSSASIVFDSNQPIATNSWENHLDRTPPVSSLNYIVDTQISNLVNLSWTGSDNHSGISKYLLYVSVNGGTFIEWLSTAATSCIFQGDSCTHYKFYIVAVDSVGNKEQDLSPEYQVMVNPFLKPVLKAAGETEVCEGDSVLLKAQSGDSLVYEWYRDNQLLQGRHDSIYYAKLSGDYSVKVSRSDACSGESAHVRVNINSIPEIVISATGNLLETRPGEVFYQWYFNTELISGATANTFLAEKSGSYRVKVTGISGCSKLSEGFQHIATSVNEYTFRDFVIFPNPAHDKLYLRYGKKLIDGVSIRIIDLSGRTVYTYASEEIISGQTLEIDLMHLNPGQYYLQIGNNNENRFFPFSKQ